jgi:hypothetical protein
MIAEIIYACCAVLSVLCFIFLFRGFRQSQSQLLLWSSLAFAFLALNNLILFADLVLLPDIEFSGGMWRVVSGAMGGCLLLFGLIWGAV